MKLLGLNLKYFRQHVESELRLDSGLSAIIGANGSGKSSLVEAISFALYGTRALRGKLEDVRTRGAVRERKPEVSLLFEHDGTVFRVERTLTDAELFAGGAAQPMVRGNREVSHKIAQILGMELEEFSAAFYTEQKGLEFLSGTKGAVEREKFIVRMMGYDRLERLQQMLREERREKRSELTGREATLGDRAELEKQLESEAVKLASCQAKLDEAAQVLQKAEAEEQRSKAQYDAEVSKRDLSLRIQAEIKALEIRHEERSARIKALADQRQRVLDAAAELREMFEAEGEQWSAAIKEKKAELKRMTAQSQKQARELAKVEDGWREQRAQLAAEIKVVRDLTRSLEQRRAGVLKLGKDRSCPTCGQLLGGSFEHVCRELELELAQSQAKQAELEIKGRELELEPEALKQLRSAARSSADRLTGLGAELEKLQALDQQRKALSRLEADLGVLRKEIEAFNEELGRQRKAAAEVKFNEESFLGVKGRYDSAQRLTEVARLQRLREQGEAQVAEAMLLRTREALEQFEERQSSARALRTEVLVMDESDALLTQFRKYLNSSIRPRLAELASEFLADLSDNRYTAVEVGEDFAAVVVDENGPRAVLSGGEEDILNLCMRLALSQMLTERSGQGLSLLILDEVFGALDENRRNNVLLLLEKLSGRFEQIVIITHFDDLKEAVQNLVYVDYNEGEARAVVSADTAVEAALDAVNV